MRKCILLTGLQRNFEPFIENQLNLVINKYNLDVFIFTSDLNSYRYVQHYADIHRDRGNIDYIRCFYDVFKCQIKLIYF